MVSASDLAFGTANLLLALAVSGVSLALLPGSDAPSSSPMLFDTPDATLSGAAASALPKLVLDSRSDPATIVFAGDIMQHAAQQNDDFDVSYAAVAPLLQSADLAVANLEFPVDARRAPGPVGDSVKFNGSPAHLDALSRAGFDILATANNHAFDQGRVGVRRTVRELLSRGIRPVGSALRRSSLNSEFVMTTIKGMNLAFFAYTATLNTYLDDDDRFVDPPRNLPVSTAHFDEWTSEYREQGRSIFRRDVERARAAGADWVVALPHWGLEWKFSPSQDQRIAAHDMIDQGFDLVVGGHGHVLNPPELYRDRLIVYSLGNFICDFEDWRARTGALLDVRVSRDASGHVGLSDFGLRALHIRRESHVVEPLTRPSVATDSETVRSWDLARSVLGPALRDEMP